MKKIKINFADIGNNNIVYDFVMSILKSLYEVEICDDPDYVFCGDFFTHEYLNYECIRIYIGGECEWPDFNMYDYAIDLVHIDINDRYLRWPFYLWRDGTRREFDLALGKHKAPIDIQNKKFCNWMVSNGISANPCREEFFYELSKYKQVDSGGRYLNNIGYKVDNKLEFQKNYKFSLAFENTSEEGYITEKIVEAWAANTVPIYWGADDITEEFNEKAFINYNKFSTMKEVIEKIKEIDNDDNLYLEMMRQPILTNKSRAKKYLSDKELLSFFKHIFEQDKEQAYRRQRYSRGKMIGDQQKKLVKQSNYYEILQKLQELKEKDIDPLHKFKGGNISIYGNGLIGKMIVDMIYRRDDINILAIYDKKLSGKKYRNINIYDISQYFDQKAACIINTVEGIHGYLQEICNGIEIFDVKDLIAGVENE
ncbi:MAG: glycosyltransferase family 10 [Clostridiales bacterium]|nr:glycosyltransferase family 10 [Clostridiales bacterium]